MSEEKPVERPSDETTVIQFHMPAHDVRALRALAQEKTLAQAVVFRDVMLAGIQALEMARRANARPSIYQLPPPLDPPKRGRPPRERDTAAKRKGTSPTERAQPKTADVKPRRKR